MSDYSVWHRSFLVGDRFVVVPPAKLFRFTWCRRIVLPSAITYHSPHTQVHFHTDPMAEIPDQDGLVGILLRFMRLHL